MRKLNFLWLAALTGIMLCPAVTSCGGKDDEPDPDDGIVQPDQDVADPAGTITLAMRDYKNGKTYLDRIYIDNENFMGSNVMFASLGKVKGLGNVSYIPADGWSAQLKVIPGEGYVAYDKSSDTYYRIYVEDYITSTAGGIIGADIKYHTPFKGADAEIQLPETAITFQGAGGSQALVFDNKNILVYDVKSDQPWCNVTKATTYDQPFLYNGIVIDATPETADPVKATITITTAYGKTKTVSVDCTGVKDAYCNIGDMTGLESIPYDGGESRVGLSTNVAASLKVETPEWLSYWLDNGSAKMRRKAAGVKFVGGKKPTRAEGFNDAEDVYEMVFSCGRGDYYGRWGDVSISSLASQMQTYPVHQYGYSTLSTSGGSDVETVSATNAGNVEFGFRMEGLSVSDLALTVPDWMKAEIEMRNSSSGSIKVTDIQNNPTENERRGEILLKGAGHVLTYTVIQKGLNNNVEISGLEDGGLYCPGGSGTYTLTVDTGLPDLTFTSSATDWVNVTYNNGQLIVRVQSTTADRVAKITCSNSRGSFEVHQSKYKVGDAYSENGVKGTVYHIGKQGRIYRNLSSNYQWSTESVQIGTSYNDGLANMALVKSIPGWKEIYPAFAAVDELNVDGVTGWYIPAMHQVEGMQINNYWTSSETDDQNAYYGYEGQALYSASKTDNMGVVAVHDFTF